MWEATILCAGATGTWLPVANPPRATKLEAGGDRGCLRAGSGPPGLGRRRQDKPPRRPPSSSHRAAHPQPRGATGLSPFAPEGPPQPLEDAPGRDATPGPASPRGGSPVPVAPQPAAGPRPAAPPAPLSVLAAGGGAAARWRPLPVLWAGSGAPRPASRPSGAAAAGARCRELGAEGGPEMGILSITDQVPPPPPPPARPAPRRARQRRYASPGMRGLARAAPGPAAAPGRGSRFPGPGPTAELPPPRARSHPAGPGPARFGAPPRSSRTAGPRARQPALRRGAPGRSGPPGLLQPGPGSERPGPGSRGTEPVPGAPPGALSARTWPSPAARPRAPSPPQPGLGPASPGPAAGARRSRTVLPPSGSVRAPGDPRCLPLAPVAALIRRR